MKCNCDPSKVFASQSTFRQHLKSNKHQLWVLRNKETDVDIYCREIEKYVNNEFLLKQKIADMERQIAILEEQLFTSGEEPRD